MIDIIEWLKLKTSAEEDAEQLELTYCHWEWRMLQSLWKAIWQMYFNKIKCILTTEPSNSMPKYLSKRNESFSLKNNLHYWSLPLCSVLLYALFKKLLSTPKSWIYSSILLSIDFTVFHLSHSASKMTFEYTPGIKIHFSIWTAYWVSTFH